MVESGAWKSGSVAKRNFKCRSATLGKAKVTGGEEMNDKSGRVQN